MQPFPLQYAAEDVGVDRIFLCKWLICHHTGPMALVSSMMSSQLNTTCSRALRQGRVGSEDPVSEDECKQDTRLSCSRSGSTSLAGFSSLLGSNHPDCLSISVLPAHNLGDLRGGKSWTLEARKTMMSASCSQLLPFLCALITILSSRR